MNCRTIAIVERAPRRRWNRKRSAADDVIAKHGKSLLLRRAVPFQSAVLDHIRATIGDKAGNVIEGGGTSAGNSDPDWRGQGQIVFAAADIAHGRYILLNLMSLDDESFTHLRDRLIGPQ